MRATYFSALSFDGKEITRFRALLSGVTLFIDVGASHGLYTFHALQVMKSGRIIAIEADPERFAILKDNIAKWAQQAAEGLTVECINAAASDELDRQRGERMQFFTTGTQISGGLFPVQERSDSYKSIEVPVITLDTLYSGHERVLVKIDVEGSELRVLKGAKRLLSDRTNHFFVEFS